MIQLVLIIQQYLLNDIQPAAKLEPESLLSIRRGESQPLVLPTEVKWTSIKKL